MTDEQEETGEALPFPAAEVAPVAADPEQVADEFLQAARDAAEESGVSVSSGRKRRARKQDDAVTVAAPPAATVVQWEPEGVGMVAALGLNLVFTRAEMPTLEPEEETKVKAVTAMYLNMRAPRAASVQPEVMIVGMLASIIGPRIAAKQLAAKMAAENNVTPSHDNLPEGRRML